MCRSACVLARLLLLERITQGLVMGWSGRAPALPWGDARPMSGLPPESGRVALISGRLRCAMKRREQVQRNCQCASTSRQKTHQAKADRAPRFRQCLIIAPRSSTCRVELHWRLGPGANHVARIADAWDRSTAPGATSRSTISSASVRLQRLRLACRSGAQLIPILATRYGWARPGHACLWTDILNPL